MVESRRQELPERRTPVRLPSSPALELLCQLHSTSRGNLGKRNSECRYHLCTRPDCSRPHCRHIHLHDREGTISCRSASFRSCNPAGQTSGAQFLAAFRIPNIRRKDFRGFSSENSVVQIIVPELSPRASEGACGNAPRATAAFAVPPLRCFIPLRRRLVPERSADLLTVCREFFSVG
jgi:hypothetical protein